MNRSENDSPVKHSTLVGNISPKCLSRSTGNDEKHKFWCKLKGLKLNKTADPPYGTAVVVFWWFHKDVLFNTISTLMRTVLVSFQIPHRSRRSISIKRCNSAEHKTFTATQTEIRQPSQIQSFFFPPKSFIHHFLLNGIDIFV